MNLKGEGGSATQKPLTRSARMDEKEPQGQGQKKFTTEGH